MPQKTGMTDMRQQQELDGEGAETRQANEHESSIPHYAVSTKYYERA